MKKIVMSGDVGWEITAAQFKLDLENANGDDIEVSISSRGGLVGEALEIFNLVRNYKGKKTAVLSGYAMSAASYIPMAFDEIIVEDNAVMMIHNAQGIAMGDHNDMTKTATILSGLSSLLSGAYAKFTGKKQKEIAAMMDEETWLYGQEIVDSGFASSMIEANNSGTVEELTSIAKNAFNGMVAKLALSSALYKKDLNRASALALGEINRPTSATKQPTEPIMDLKDLTLAELKEKRPDLVVLITDEATAGHAELIAKATESGSKAELTRIQAIHGQSYPGQEAIVTAAMFDGKSQAGDVAMAINAANIEAMKKVGSDNSDDANFEVDEPTNSMESVKKGNHTEATLKAKWDKDAKMQAEFMGDFELCKSAMIPVEGLAFKSLKNRGEE